MIPPAVPGFSAPSIWTPRLFWGFQTAFWSVGILLLVVLLTAFEPADHLFSIVAGRLITGLLLTTLMHRFYQTALMRSQTRPAKWLIVILLAVGLSLVTSIVWMGLIDHLGFHEVASDNPFYSITTTRLFGLLLWNVTYFGVDLLQTSHAIQLDAARAKLAARAAELKQLQAQLNPHFLFNALNIVKASTAEPPIAAEAVQTLADYLRFSLRESRPLEPLSRELDALELYLRLQYIRFQDDLDCRIEATPAAMNARVPPMLVQPLLENAFKYGARTSAMPLRMQVRASADAGWLTITVANSGAWVPPAVGSEATPGDADGDTGTGIGLTNLRRRLALVFGERATLKLGEDDATVTATLHLPLIPATPETL
jgi:two-component system, LytTR family, sensor kinase